MRFLSAVVAVLVSCVALCSAAEARVRINVDLSSQTMHVASASGDYDWPISSARSGFRTPRGTYGVQSLQTMHYSRKYHNSPMPHSIFFSGGYAIHGTYATGSLGSPASHGCIRISPGNAAALFQMVRAEGASISISGSAPASEYRYAERGERRHTAERGFYRDQADYYAGRRGGYYGSDALGYAEPATGQGFFGWMSNPTGY